MHIISLRASQPTITIVRAIGQHAIGDGQAPCTGWCNTWPDYYLYSNQLEDHRLFVEQFAHWKQGNMNDTEEVEIDRLVKPSSMLKQVNEEILKLARSIEHATIDKIMVMDEIELDEAVLSGKIKPP